MESKLKVITKKLIISFFSLLLLLGLFNLQVNALNESSISDQKIKEILEVYYSSNNNNKYKSSYYEANKTNISKKDINEFRKYYEIETKAGSSYSKYFNSTKWITRSGVVSLSINYKSSGLYPSNLPNANAAAAYKAWEVLYARHKNDSKWKNTKSMEAQFICHSSTIGKLKNPWNIEPHRTETNLVATIAKKCTP